MSSKAKNKSGHSTLNGKTSQTKSPKAKAAKLTPKVMRSNDELIWYQASTERGEGLRLLNEEVHHFTTNGGPGSGDDDVGSSKVVSLAQAVALMGGIEGDEGLTDGTWSQKARQQFMNMVASELTLTIPDVEAEAASFNSDVRSLSWVAGASTLCRALVWR